MFVQVIEGRTSDPDALQQRIELWHRELRPGAIGFLGSAGGCTTDGSFLIAARFEDRDAATRNAERPEQSAWWLESQSCIDGDATFHDTEDVRIMSHGRLDDAQFIQVMEGHVSDRLLADQLEAQSDPILAKVRPDLLGSITAFYGKDDFADMAFFSSEREARENESREMPADMAEMFGQWEKVMRVDRFLDIPEPWMTSQT